MVKVSVIMAVYNGEKYLRKTIDSVLRQEVELELLIIDDGSTDGSAKIVKEIKDPRIKYLYQKNSGNPAGPRNKGIAMASGQFIAFCDQDDLWHQGKLKKQIKAYENATNKDDIGLVVSSADIVDARGNIITRNQLPESYLDKTEAFSRLLNGNFITTCSALLPLKIFQEIGPLDERLTGVDDYDLWLKITAKYGILVLGERLCAWRKDDSSLSYDKTKLYEENEALFDKLETKVKDESVKIGHGKNLMRIIVSAILNKDDKKAEKYISKTALYPVSKKGEYIIGLYKKNKELGYLAVVFLKSIGKVKL